MLKVRARPSMGVSDGFGQFSEFNPAVNFFVSHKNGEAQRRVALHHFTLPICVRSVAILPVVFLTVDVPAGLLQLALDAGALSGRELAAGATVEGFLHANRGLFGGESLRLAARQFAAADALLDARLLPLLARVDRPGTAVRPVGLRLGRQRKR